MTSVVATTRSFTTCPAEIKPGQLKISGTAMVAS